jgi:hypothetical protein
VRNITPAEKRRKGWKSKKAEKREKRNRSPEKEKPL